MIPSLTPVAVALAVAREAGAIAAGLLVRVTGKRWRSARAMRDAAVVAKNATTVAENATVQPSETMSAREWNSRSGPLWDWIAAERLPRPHRFGRIEIDQWEAEWDLGPRSASLILRDGRLEWCEISLKPGVPVVEAEWPFGDPAAAPALRVLLADYGPPP